MLIKVKDLAGRATELEADASWRIKDVCRRAAELLGLPPKIRCCLYSKGTRLADTSTLKSAGVSSDEVLVLIALRRRGAKEQGEGTAAAGPGADAVATPPTPVIATRSFNPPLTPEVSCFEARNDPLDAPPSASLNPPTSTSVDSPGEPGEPNGSLGSSRSDSTQSTQRNQADSSICNPESAIHAVDGRPEVLQAQTRDISRPGADADGPCEGVAQASTEGCRSDSLVRETAATPSSDPQSSVEGSQGQAQDRRHAPGDEQVASPPATTADDHEQTVSPALSSQVKSRVRASPRLRPHAAKRRGSPESPLGEQEGSVKAGPQLPAALAELEAKFSVVNAVWGFMSGQMVETTWERLLQGLEGTAASSTQPITLQDIKSMATMAPHVVKLLEISDGPGAPDAEEGTREGASASGFHGASGRGAAGDDRLAPGTGTAAEASEGGPTGAPESFGDLREDWGQDAAQPPHPLESHRARPEESSDCVREDEGEAADGPTAVQSGSECGALDREGPGGDRGREPTHSPGCAAEQGVSPSSQANFIVKLVDKLTVGPASTPRADTSSATGERAWRPVDEGPQLMRLSVTAIGNRVERRRAAFAAALEAAAQRVRSDWLMQLGGSNTAPASNPEELTLFRSVSACTSKAPLGTSQAECQDNLGAFHALPLSVFLAEAEASAAWAREGHPKQAAAPSAVARKDDGGRHGQRGGDWRRKRAAARAARASGDGPVQKRMRKQRGSRGASSGEAFFFVREGEAAGAGSGRGTRGTGTARAGESQEGAGTGKGTGVGAGEEAREEAEEGEEGEEGEGSVLDPVVPRLSREELRKMRWRRACGSTQELSSDDMLAHLREGLGAGGQMVHCERLPQRKARHRRVGLPLSEGTLAVLERMGISRLYHHQATAIEAAMRGQHVVVSTPTASGKSLCYNIPVLEAYQRSSDACALYLFPTKALTQDQQRALEQLTEPLTDPPIMNIYDGDTPFSKRAGVRNSSNILLTNPDMLHMTILPQYKDFARLLSNLKYVVVDEAHSYSGAFGCHTAVILRRLRRICARVYGAFPTFIVCTATCANPEEHAQTLVGVEGWCAVGPQDDGSPCGDKTFVLWNPPVIGTPMVTVASRSKRRQTPAARDPAPILEQRRCSPIVEVALLLAEMVQHNLRCLAFCKTRKLSELVLSYTKDMLRERCPELVSSVVAYRSGYSAEDRRRIEKELFGGRLRAVAATNALELGVDIGSLDATVHLGFQGTVASLWQQAGRAGRREKASLSIYVAFGCPLDQYFMAAPERLFSRPIEAARLDAQNPEVLKQQVMCAAAELPLLVDTDAPFFFSQRPPRRGPAHLVTKGEAGAGGCEGQGVLRPKLEVPGEGEAGVDMASLPGVPAEGMDLGGAGGAQGQEACARDSGGAPPAEVGRSNPVSSRDGPQAGGVLGTAEEMQGRRGSGSGSRQSSRGRMEALVKHLNETGMLGRSPTDCHVDQSWRYIGAAARVWNEVKIRAIDEHCFAVVDERTGAVMEEIEEKKAFFTIFEGAVYMQQGKTYIVTALDLQRREAKCRRASVRYWTSVLDMTDVQLTGGTLAYETVNGGTPGADGNREGTTGAPGTTGRGFLGSPGEAKAEDKYWDSGPARGTPLVEYSPSGIVTSAQWSTCIVSTSYPSYRKVWRGANIPFDQVDLFLPRITFPTQACWIRVPSGAREAVAGLAKEGDPPLDYGSSLHAACHAVMNVLPAYLACSPADVGSECKHPNDTRFFPDRVLLFDRHTGGIGLAPQICNVFGDLLLAALQVVSRCECAGESGCPGCIHTAGCASYNRVLCKAGAKAVLEALVETECKTAEEHRAVA